MKALWEEGVKKPRQGQFSILKLVIGQGHLQPSLTPQTADLIIPGYRVARLTPLKSAQPVFPWLWKKNVVSVIYLSTHLILPDISNPNGLNLCESVVFHHVVKWATSNLQS